MIVKLAHCKKKGKNKRLKIERFLILFKISLCHASTDQLVEKSIKGCEVHLSILNNELACLI